MKEHLKIRKKKIIGKEKTFNFVQSVDNDRSAISKSVYLYVNNSFSLRQKTDKLALNNDGFDLVRQSRKSNCAAVVDFCISYMWIPSFKFFMFYLKTCLKNLSRSHFQLIVQSSEGFYFP